VPRTRASTLRAELTPTARNKPCLDFFRRSGLRAADENVFTWDASQPYERPRCVTVFDHAGVPTALDP
jgi:hypothetical protein